MDVAALSCVACLCFCPLLCVCLVACVCVCLGRVSVLCRVSVLYPAGCGYPFVYATDCKDPGERLYIPKFGMFCDTTENQCRTYPWFDNIVELVAEGIELERTQPTNLSWQR